MAKQQLVGFGRGFATPFKAAGSLMGQPRVWPLALVPAVAFLLVEAAFVVGSWRLWAPRVSATFADDTWWQKLLAALALWIPLLLLAAFGWIAAAVIAPVLSAPALERIVGIVERELGAPARAPLGFFAELWCGMRSMLLSVAVMLPLVVVLTLLEVLVAPLAVVTTPLKLLLGALGVAWGLFDYPLTLRGIGARQRLAFMRRHFSAVLGFGAAFSLVFWLPCFGILMLPVGVAAATRLYWEIERSSLRPAGPAGPRLSV